MSWLNPNADPLPEDPAELRVLAKTVEKFLAAAEERAEDIECNEQRDAERREHHRRAVELSPRVEMLQSAWAKAHAAAEEKKPTKAGTRKKATKSEGLRGRSIKALEKQAEELLAEIRELGIDGEGWTRASLLGGTEAWKYFLESLSLKGRPIQVRLKSKEAVALNAELVRYGVSELRPVERPELFIKLDGADLVNRALHGDSAKPVVVGRAKLEAARKGAEELQNLVASGIRGATKAKNPAPLAPTDSNQEVAVVPGESSNSIKLARDYTWFCIGSARYDLAPPLPKIVQRLHLAGRGLRNNEIPSDSAIDFRMHRLLSRGPMAPALSRLIVVQDSGKRGKLYALAPVEVVDADASFG